MHELERVGTIGGWTSTLVAAVGSVAGSTPSWVLIACAVVTVGFPKLLEWLLSFSKSRRLADRLDEARERLAEKDRLIAELRQEVRDRDFRRLVDVAEDTPDRPFRARPQRPQDAGPEPEPNL